MKQDDYTVYINAASCIGKPSLCKQWWVAMYFDIDPHLSVNPTTTVQLEQVQFPDETVVEQEIQMSS